MTVILIWFTGEKVFTLARLRWKKSENDRLYARATTKKTDKSKTLYSSKNDAQSVADCVSRRVKIKTTGYTGLIFIDPGVKVNEIYYCDMPLT